MQVGRPLPTHLARAQLRAINHRSVNTFVVQDPGFLETLVDDDFLFTTSNGEWIDREGYLAFRRYGGQRCSAYCEGVRVRIYGSVALVQGTVRTPLDDGLHSCWRYSDVFVWRHGIWRLVSSQHTSVQPGIPLRLQAGASGRYACWAGADPTGDTHDVLASLNEQYVQAYRAADAAWYNAHLAPDYNAVQSDGTLSDRADALNRFAQPHFAMHMREFPVGQVRIRLFGELALIHAENAYTRKDGHKGVSRYTDIWRIQRGRWSCVSAHITAHHSLV